MIKHCWYGFPIWGPHRVTGKVAPTHDRLGYHNCAQTPPIPTSQLSKTVNMVSLIMIWTVETNISNKSFR